MNKTLLVLVAAFALFFPSCDIWEDRQSCPSYLEVDCSYLEGKANSAEIWLFSSEGYLVHRLRITEHELSQWQRFSVSKGDYRCYVWANVGDNTVTADLNSMGGTLYKKAGVSADRLYWFAALKSCRQETEYLRVEPKQMFINVYVTVKGLKEGESVSLHLSSDFDGYTLAGRALRQASVIDTTISDQALMRVLRPQELEGMKITAEFYFKGGETLTSGFDLGGYLNKSGYDLSGADLKDVLLTVDVSRLKAGIGVDPFETVPPVVIRF